MRIRNYGSKQFRLGRVFKFSGLMGELYNLIGAPLVFLALKLKISANGVDVISVLFIFTAAVISFSENNYVFWFAMISIFFSHVWDYVDGEVARRTNSSSFKGNMFDETAGTLIADISYVLLSVNLILKFNSIAVIFLAFFVIIFRQFRLKNFFLRIFLSKSLRIDRKNNEPYIQVSITEINSKIEKHNNKLLKAINKIFLSLSYNEVYYVVIGIVTSRFIGANVLLLLTIGLIPIIIVKQINDLIWALSKNPFSDFEFELIKESYRL